MKALLYKEFKLAMHPICYVFVFLFPIMILIPSYPLGIGFIYVLTCYPVLFLGANKGQQSNDLLFSTLLPVRKKDIVLARIFTVAIMQFIFIAVMSALYPLARYFHSSTETIVPGITLDGYMTLLAFVIIGYAVADLIFFPIYYRKGKSIVGSTLATILGFVAYIGITTIGLPFVPGVKDVFTYLYAHQWVQAIILVVSFAIYFAIHIAVYKVSAKRLEKVDF
ncbi:MAG: ABC-2 transporter permease [Bacilli bacterium]|nr:ABC-2 transporter permease [Bacilli bacterium]